MAETVTTTEKAPSGASTTTKVAPAPPPPSPLDDQVADRGKAVDDLMLKAAEKIGAPRDIPPLPTFTVGQQIAAGILAALDPEGYDRVVKPAIEGKRRDQMLQQKNIEDNRNAEQQAFGALLSVAQHREQRAIQQAQFKEMQATREQNAASTAANARTAEANAAETRAKNDALEESRTQDRNAASRAVQGVANGLKSLMPQIVSYAQGAKNDEETAVGQALAANAQALQAELSGFLQSGEPASAATAQQFATKMAQLEQQHMAALTGRATRKLSMDKANLTNTRMNMSMGQVDTWSKETKRPSEQAIELFNFFKTHNKNWLTLYGNSTIGALKGKVLPKDLLEFTAKYTALALPIRQSYLGKQITMLENEGIKNLMPLDPSDVTVEQMYSGLQTVAGMAAGQYVASMESLTDAGFNTQAMWDTYNTDIRPYVPLSAIHLMEAPHDMPQGTMAQYLTMEGVVLVTPPGGQSRQPWSPETPEEGLYVARLMNREHFGEARIRQNLKGFTFDDAAVERIMEQLGAVK